MTRIQKVLAVIFLFGIVCFSLFHIFMPPLTADDYLKSFHASVQKTLYHMRFSETKAAQRAAQNALKAIKEGIKHFPNRLDLRLSEIHFCQMTGQTSCITNGMANTLEQAQYNAHQWEWSTGEMKGKGFMLSAFQNYQKNLWLAKEDEAFKKNAELILSFYPDNILNLDNLGVYYLEHKEYDKAREYLEKARLLAPSDKDVSAHFKNISNLQKKETKEPAKQAPQKPAPRKRTVSPLKAHKK